MQTLPFFAGLLTSPGTGTYETSYYTTNLTPGKNLVFHVNKDTKSKNSIETPKFIGNFIFTLNKTTESKNCNPEGLNPNDTTNEYSCTANIKSVFRKH